MRFSLAWLFVLVLVAAVGCAALINANQVWKQSLVTLALTALVVATISAAIVRPHSFSLGFALAGWIYLLLAFVPAIGLRDDLATDLAVQRLFAAIHEDELAASTVRSVAFTPDGSLLATGSGTGTVRLWNLNTGAPAVADSKAAHFDDIGHALWLLLFACLGGVLARMVAPRMNPAVVASQSAAQDTAET